MLLKSVIPALSRSGNSMTNEDEDIHEAVKKLSQRLHYLGRGVNGFPLENKKVIAIDT